MDWIKRMSLKKALFTLTSICLLIAIVLSVIAFLGCVELRTSIANEGFVIDPHTGDMVSLSTPSEQILFIAKLLEVLQYVLPVLIFVISSLITATLFYRLKLKMPLSILTNSANRIISNDLDFMVEVSGTDELGKLCKAFETMRSTLLANNRELWRQAEERKRLNAAFSHDLRNPVTVLKGSAKLAKQGLVSGKATQEQLTENLTRIEDYTSRIERYVEIMSSVQKLEQIPLCEKNIEWNEIVSELENTVQLVGLESNKQIHFEANKMSKTVFIDKSILYEITENLVANALRYAKQDINITCVINGTNMELSVQDDGDGFSSKLIKNGIQPFQKGSEETDHFGMGLYICNLLCQKHGGSLELENNQTGAKVTAILKIK